jgi:hypothetical protein
MAALEGLVGLLRHRTQDRPATVEEMNEAIRARATEKYGNRRKSGHVREPPVTPESVLF